MFFEYFRGDKRTVDVLYEIGYDDLYLTAVTVAETYHGMHKKEKRRTTEEINRFNLLHIDATASAKFLDLMLGYYDKGLSVPDGLIAATCLTHKAKLFTLNRKDFDFIKGIKFFDP
ncbi:MAG: PIN domain-containing protein [Cytophagales bacterium]|nr:PIN domain-containing protein [Cytophagales bacterium]